MTTPDENAVDGATESCLTCGRPLTLRGPHGECPRCLINAALLPDEDATVVHHRIVPGPLRYAHFEVEVGEDGFPVELGAGAMAVTYRARDTILQSVVALKVIDRQMAENPAARARFLREARAAAQLHHPNVARVTYYGEQDDECFYVMEFVEGETFEERVRREGPVPIALGLEIIVQTARALAAAEACGVVHRDIKPSNLMIASRQGESRGNDSLVVKMIDFGVARVAETGADQTQAGFVGTPAFASPEQFAGAGRTLVDTRSDIYSLGVTFWYLLSGRTPFVGRSFDEIRTRQSGELPLDHLKAANAPPQVIALLKSMLAFDPAQRPQSARELLAAILQCHKGEQEAPAWIEAAARREEGFWIAVLPFKFSGASSEIAVLADGLNEEIVTGLARFPYLRVIARSSTSRFVTETPDLRRIGHELGARYVLEGSLRQSGNTLRVATRLVDTDSGTHLWAETFDRNPRAEGIFVLQDEITDRIVAPVADVYGVLARAIASTTGAKHPESLTPYEAVWRFFLAQQQSNEKEHLAARIALEHAVELQPGYADAWAALAVVYIDEYRQGFNPLPDPLDRALAAAERAIDASAASQMANYAFAVAQFFRGNLSAFRAKAASAMALNPRCSYTLASLGRLICYSGEWERGVELSKRAIELSTHHPGWYYMGIIVNEYRQRRYAEALAVLQTTNRRDYWVMHLMTAITQAQLGNRSAAQAEVERTLRAWPGFAQMFGRAHLWKWFRYQPDLIDHMLEGARLAGFRIAEEESQAAPPDTLDPVELQADLTETRPDFATRPGISVVKRHSVGRQKELAELDRAFESAAAGQALFLCVTGEPGIGKTTLVEDFLSELAAAGRPCALARGRCSERLAGSEAYLPFLEALESLLHGDGGEAATRVMRASAPNWYAQVVPPATVDASLARVLAESQAATQERLKRELGAFLQELSQLRPLILFFDDLHWADASTVDLLAYLGGKCAGMRVLLVLTYRPSDLAMGKHPFGPVKLDLQARGVARELALEFLTRPDLDRYLALEFPGHCFPEEFAALIHARTEGSPLFMADLLRYLRDRKVLTLEQDGWTLQESVPDIQRDLPESVRGMIQRKIGQLGEDDRRLLVAAGVQGYEFDSAVVARVLEWDAADVEDRLDELDRVHAFVRFVREQEFPDRTLTQRYRFVHVLYQNALYAALQPTRRALLSAAVAQALLGYYGQKSADVAAELALLLEAARDFAQAAGFFLLAAQNAARIFANEEAVVLARRGIDLLAALPDTPERAHKELALQITLGPALFATKDWTAPDVEMAYTRAHELCRALEESPDLFPAMWGLFLFRIARGEIQTALNLGGQLLGLAERTQDPALLLQAHHALGPTYTLVGDWAAARASLDQAISHYDPREHCSHAFVYGGHDPCACCLGFAAKTLWMLGYPEQALQRGRGALVLARKLGHPTSLAHAQLSIAILHQFRRDVSETLELAEALQKLAADQGLLFYLSGGSVLRGWALVEQGHSKEGLAQMREGFDTGGATRAHWRSYFLALLAGTCGKAGNTVEGLTVLAEALTVVEKTGICIYEPEMHRLKGELLLALEPAKTADAEVCFRQAVEIARRHRAKSLELRAATSLARLSQQQGCGTEARSALAAVYSTYTEGLATPDLVDATALLRSLA